MLYPLSYGGEQRPSYGGAEPGQIVGIAKSPASGRGALKRGWSPHEVEDIAGSVLRLMGGLLQHLRAFLVGMRSCVFPWP